MSGGCCGVTDPTPEPETSDDDTRFTRWLVLGAVIVIVAVSLVAYFSHWPWLSSLWFNYAWTSDKGNGPEAIQQTIIYALVAVLVIPPVRRWFGRRFHDVHEKIDTVHATVRAHIERVEIEHKRLHRKLDHIIDQSPNIDPLPPEPTED